jgi:hypothetical protein
VEEVRGVISDYRGGEEIMEGEPRGETQAQGQGGFHGEPLHNHPL